MNQGLGRERFNDESPQNAQGVTYAQAGVDIVEGARAVEAIRDIVHATYRPEVIGDIGGFGGLFSIAQALTMDDPVLVSGTDGVGTKLKVAQLAGVHDTVGIDLVAMCANDILATGAEPLFFLDYLATGKISASAAAAVVGGIGRGCEQAGCALIGGEMAEHPGVMDPSDYDLSGFCVGIVDRAQMLDPASAKPGDELIGLASSGLHSNGYSLARKVLVEGRALSELVAPEPRLGGTSVLAALLEPTRIYVKSVRAVLQKHPGAVRALAHITGGGITENLNRALNPSVDAVIDVGTWPVAPIVTLACAAARLSSDEAFKTFNMGLGMILVVDPLRADEVCSALVEAGEEPFRVGVVQDGSGCVRYRGRGACASTASDAHGAPGGAGGSDVNVPAGSDLDPASAECDRAVRGKHAAPMSGLATQGACTDKLKVGVLVSGGGTNLQALIDAARAGAPFEVACVVASRPGIGALARAKAAGIPTLALERVSYADPASADARIVEALQRAGVDCVVMAGYMRKATPVLLDAYPNAVINLHPALLPAFKGAHAIRDAFEAGVKVTGVTVHLANEDYDRGPIIAQRAVRVHEGDSLDALEARIHAVEHALLPEVVAKIAEGKVSIGTLGRVEVTR